MESVTMALDRLRTLLEAVLKIPGFRGAVTIEFHVDSDAKSIKIHHQIVPED